MTAEDSRGGYFSDHRTLERVQKLAAALGYPNPEGSDWQVLSQFLLDHDAIWKVVENKYLRPQAARPRGRPAHSKRMKIVLARRFDRYQADKGRQGKSLRSLVPGFWKAHRRRFQSLDPNSSTGTIVNYIIEGRRQWQFKLAWRERYGRRSLLSQ